MVSAAYLAGRSARIPITSTATLTTESGTVVSSALHAEVRPINKRSVFWSEVEINAQDQEIVLWDSEVSSNPPRPGYKITISSIDYRVLDVVVQLAGTRHHCRVAKFANQ